MVEIDSIIGRILDKDGEFIGTGFLVNSKCVVTARHVVDQGEKELFIHLKNNKITLTCPIYEEANLFKQNPDIAFFEIEEQTAITNFYSIDLEIKDSSIGEKWYSFGYPFNKREERERYEGKIHQVNIKGNIDYDLELKCEAPNLSDKAYESSGSSGSPIISGNRIIGVFIGVNAGSIVRVASFKRSFSFIEKYNLIEVIEVEEQLLTSFQKKVNVALDGLTDFINGHSKGIEAELTNNLVDFKANINKNILSVEKFFKTANLTVDNSYNEDIFRNLDTCIEFLFFLWCISDSVTYCSESIYYNLVINDNKYMKYNVSYLRRKSMGESILSIARKILQENPSIKNYIKLNMPIFPGPLVFDNFDDKRRLNLCKCCGQEFPFNEVLYNSVKTEDDEIIQGLEKNDFSYLNRETIYCSDCLKEVLQEEDTNGENLKRKGMDKIYEGI